MKLYKIEIYDLFIGQHSDEMNELAYETLATNSKNIYYIKKLINKIFWNKYKYFCADKGIFLILITQFTADYKEIDEKLSYIKIIK